jgi:HSP20 family protein
MMDLIRWNPWREMTDFRSQLSRFFDTPLLRAGWTEDEGRLGAWQPAVDVYEKDDTLVIKAELPGLEKKDIGLDFRNGVLTLTGERNNEKEVKEERFFRREITRGKFIRAFALPADYDVDKIAAEFKDGVLRIEVPKPEGSKPRQITVH